MHYMIISLVLFIIAVGCFFGTYLQMKGLDYSDSDTQQKCNSMHLTNVKEGDNCGAWDGTQCRRGIVTNGLCIAKGNVTPLILFVSGSLFFIAFVIFIILAVVYRG